MGGYVLVFILGFIVNLVRSLGFLRRVKSNRSHTCIYNSSHFSLQHLLFTSGDGDSQHWMPNIVERFGMLRAKVS